MPLDKRWRGLRVIRAKRQGNRIHVRLRNPPGSSTRNTRVSLSEQAYRDGLSCVFRHDRSG